MAQIVIFADGTGNSSFAAEKTNVWRLYDSLDRSAPDQKAFYMDGVGTSKIKVIALIDSATGFGVPHNVRTIYSFLCRNWHPRDEIFMFGFSRGSFAVRTLLGFINVEGLVPPAPEEDFRRNVIAAYRHYRKQSYPLKWYRLTVGLGRWLRDSVLYLRDRLRGWDKWNTVRQRIVEAGRDNIPVKFVGLFDTVEAYGVPIEELRIAIDKFIWPLSFDNQVLGGNVTTARHALSIDDERRTFRPLLWDERNSAPGRIKQIWFAGMHSDVGGGYPDDALAHVLLNWMLQEAIAAGLSFDPVKIKAFKAAASPIGPAHNSRAGFSSMYRYVPRPIDYYCGTSNSALTRSCIVHHSVAERLDHGCDGYAPVALPGDAQMHTHQGALQPLTRVIQPAPDYDKQARFARDNVWWRRIIYFSMVVSIALFALFPWINGVISSFIGEFIPNPILRWLRTGEEGIRSLLGLAAEFASGLLPGFARRWVDAIVERPLAAVLLIGLIVACYVFSGTLQGRIRDRMRFAWNKGVWPTAHPTALSRRISVFLLVTSVVAALFLIYFDKPSWSIASFLVAGWFFLTLDSNRREGIYIREAIAAAAGEAGGPSGGVLLNIAYRIRTCPTLDKISYFFARKIFPTFALILIFVVAVVGASRLWVTASSAMGFVCSPQAKNTSSPTDAPGEPKVFDERDVCWDSGYILQTGERYRIWMTVDQKWFDRTIIADPAGFEVAEPVLTISRVIRRWFSEPWFKPIARIGERMNNDWVLEPLEGLKARNWPQGSKQFRANDSPENGWDQPLAEANRPDAEKLWDAASLQSSLTSEFTAPASGRLYLYVNDAIMAFPFIGTISPWYRNNSGTARVVVQRAPIPPVPK